VFRELALSTKQETPVSFSLMGLYLLEGTLERRAKKE